MGSPERSREWLLRKKFNMSQAIYDRLSEEQNHVCYICHGRDDFSEFMAVDHCHTNGHVRGLLCRNCNRALGQFQDNVDFLERAIVYLKKDPPVLGEPEPPKPAKPHRSRARWRCIVTTPDQTFSSYKEAGDHFGVHATTVMGWCLEGKSKRAGFSSEKVFGAEHE